MVFHSKATLAPLHGQLARDSVLTVKVETIATFLGRAIAPDLAQEIGSRLPHFARDDVFSTNDVSFFKHYQTVEHRKGPSSKAFAPMKKNIHGLGELAGILFTCNQRYLAHLSTLDDFSAGVKLLGHVTRPRKTDGKTVKGVDFFNSRERTLLGALQNPRFNIAGVRRADLSPLLDHLSPSALSRQISRLRHLGLIKHIGETFRYYFNLRRQSRHRRGVPHQGIRYPARTRVTDSGRKVTRIGW